MLLGWVLGGNGGVQSFEGVVGPEWVLIVHEHLGIEVSLELLWKHAIYNLLIFVEQYRGNDFTVNAL